ncbi:putative cytochrome P450 [Helianthus annuus]|uniref:Cytochrome P450 n=1 Tax=Helianthus annuus TaxID=4232 RepID=A0A251VQH3_HELAN|nr:tryptamine 5-hydroxylase [Helianthus annuus]KAF5823057.1 putative cytochrome P450 [Helianthus annuus]KAJ0627812.1 putative cytochrome P450 [Helianthus annuus]KAJ0949095.1 putative cytochrome P450 [Helianthus annuus]
MSPTQVFSHQQLKMDDFTFAVVCMSLVSFTTITYFLRCRKPSTSATHLPPSPPGLPVIGHLHYLTDLPHQAFARLANQLGPIFYLRLGQVPTIVVSSAQLAELVLKTHDHVFANRPQLISAQYLSFGCSDVTFSKYGPYWRQARKICVTELLSPKRVNSFQLVRNEEVTRLVQAVSTRSGVETDLSELIFRLANDMLCRVAFGKRFVPGEKKKNLVSVLSETQALFAGFGLGEFYPELEWVNTVSGMKRRLMKNLKDLTEVCDDIIHEHLKNKVEPGKEDFVDVLLRVQQQHDLEVPITDANLKALVLDMFVAGTDTTSATLEWAMTELVLHPKVMKKAQDEIRGIVGSKGEVEERHLHQFHYLTCVIKETMRLHPAAPLLVPRESMQRCTLNGYDVPEKTRVLVNAYAIGRDPNLWENPLVYDPERFVGKDIDFKGHDFRFLPFGSGRRGCPGSAFGLATVQLALAQLLHHFNWEHSGPSTDVDLEEIFGLAIRKKTALILVPTNNKNPGDQQ